MEPNEKLVLTMKEMQRIEILRRVETRRLTVEAGATALGRSVRTVFRMLGNLRAGVGARVFISASFHKRAAGSSVSFIPLFGGWPVYCFSSIRSR